MTRLRLRIFAIVVAGTMVAGTANFLAFIYLYRSMVAEHLTEYWRTVHGGEMLTKALPLFLLVALVSVGVVVLATQRYSRHS